MSDFLTRLAQLTHGEASVVSPRLPGRFAPMPDTGFTEAVGVGIEQQSEAGVAYKSTPGVPAQQAGREAPLPDSSSESPQNQPIAAEQVRRESGSPQVPTHSGEADRVIDHSPIVPVSRTAAAQKPESPARRDSLAETGRPGESGRKQPVPVGTQSDTPIGGAEKINQADGLPAISLPDQSPLLVQLNQDRRAEPQQALLQQPLGTQAATKQQASVHINIGRVEVRAHTAAPKPAPRISKPDSQSSLSLQDYLKGGRSRAGRS
jgi:hypothetical protein